MKKLERKDQGIDYAKLFADYSARRKIADYSEQAIREFSEGITQSLQATVNAEHRVRGFRAEAVFQAVVAGIGKVALLKAEDSGDVFFTGDDLQIPDFRIVLRDGSQMLVEVKAQRLENSFDKPLKLSNGYVQKVLRYASLTRTELRFAIFWEETSRWTLNRLDAFDPGVAGEKQWSISFVRAMATNELASIGDCTIATLAPLRFRVLFDPDRSERLPPEGGPIQVTIAGVKLFSQDTVLEGLSAEIGWKLLWYGEWEEIGQDSHTEGDHLVWVEHLYGPRGWSDRPHEPHEIAPVGALSEMISRAYLQGAERTIHTSATGEILKPGYMGNFIPPDFPSLKLALPLYELHLRPNFNFDPDKDYKNSSATSSMKTSDGV
jgi:hypothetical protein